MRALASLSASGRAVACVLVGALATLVLSPHHGPPWVIAFLLALLGVSLLFRPLLGGVRVTRVAATRLMEGEPGTLEVFLTTPRGRTPLVLSLQGRADELQAGPRLHPMPAAGSSRCHLDVRGLQRGHATHLKTVLHTTAPFGLLHHRRTATVPCDLWVLPAGRDLREAVLEQLLELRPRGQERPQPVGPGDSEFHSLREFRPGDPERRVHFRATARHGRKVLRVLRGEAPPKVRLVLDLRVAPTWDSFGSHDFEESVRLVAGVATSLVRRQVPVFLDVMDGSGCRALVPPVGAHLDQYLRALALVQPVTLTSSTAPAALPAATSPDERRLLIHQGLVERIQVDASWILLQAGTREYWNLLQPRFRFHRAGPA